ncbi:pilus assembly protein TadG-related protein [Spirillospora sp. CA-142024]|uniref:pilus assembly protein TadG-related protein n=1 Tax=Spirillospora sp. CA-142024 TaxID=3240036 RepID=UPI003D8A70C2
MPVPMANGWFLTRARAQQHPPDEGSISVFAVIITLVVVVFFGAVVDFEQALEARQDANTIAQEAARAGAGHIDLNRAYTAGRFTVDRATALRAAQEYLRNGGYNGTVTPSGAHAIGVHVSITRPALFLPVIGIATLHADASAVANLTTGVEGPSRP